MTQTVKNPEKITMKMNKKLLSLTALTAVFAGGFVGTAHAQVDVEVNADFLTALVLSKVNDISYGTIEQSAAISGTDTATMNTPSLTLVTLVARLQGRLVRLTLPQVQMVTLLACSAMRQPSLPVAVVRQTLQ